MAKAIGMLDRLKGKKVFFQGRFQYGIQDQLKVMAEAQGATIASDLHKSIEYLVLSELTSGKTAQKKVASLNAKAASIQVIDAESFRKLVEPTDNDVLAMIHSGASSAGVFNRTVSQS